MAPNATGRVNDPGKKVPLGVSSTWCTTKRIHGPSYNARAYSSDWSQQRAERGKTKAHRTTHKTHAVKAPKSGHGTMRAQDATNEPRTCDPP